MSTLVWMQINSSLVLVMRGGMLSHVQWRDVMVGDIVKVLTLPSRDPSESAVLTCNTALQRQIAPF